LAGPVTAVDDDPDTARDIAAACVAWYLCAMGGVYADSVSSQGFADEVSAIIEANPRPSPRRGIIPPAAQPVLDQLAAYGTADQVQAQLKLWSDSAEVVSVLLAPGVGWPTIEATLRAAAP
jgi:hypothetical protein